MTLWLVKFQGEVELLVFAGKEGAQLEAFRGLERCCSNPDDQKRGFTEFLLRMILSPT